VRQPAEYRAADVAGSLHSRGRSRSGRQLPRMQPRLPARRATRRKSVRQPAPRSLRSDRGPASPRCRLLLRCPAQRRRPPTALPHPPHSRTTRRRMTACAPVRARARCRACGSLTPDRHAACRPCVAAVSVPWWEPAQSCVLLHSRMCWRLAECARSWSSAQCPAACDCLLPGRTKCWGGLGRAQAQRSSAGRGGAGARGASVDGLLEALLATHPRAGDVHGAVGLRVQARACAEHASAPGPRKGARHWRPPNSPAAAAARSVSALALPARRLATRKMCSTAQRREGLTAGVHAP
jgi:hypothetical protein